MEVLNEKEVKDRVAIEEEGIEFGINLLHSAAFSPRRTITCVPFPERYLLPGKQPDFVRLQKDLESLPPIIDFHRYNFNSSQISLLSDIIQNPLVQMKQIPFSTFSKKSGFPSKVELMPKYVFKVKYSSQYPLQSIFKSHKSKHGSFIAYHGSAFQNFYSILNNGLNIDFSKRQKNELFPKQNLYGEGIYLSTNPLVSQNFVQMGRARPHSPYEEYGALSVCQVVNSEEMVKKPDVNGGAGQRDYIVVLGNQYVQLKYILVYVKLRKGNSKNVAIMWITFGMICIFVILFMFFKSHYYKRLKFQYGF
eukprot:TRINITY_DN12001_c0_g1_i1.p1 TRINITY_DN12001_c0_g1~~TRINITY_DN12001_c0_g1_i1.p1  ORF type:complete len:307 (-),score=55.90 TRINITY_DN12001_c0_g1_i1:3-923(-)